MVYVLKRCAGATSCCSLAILNQISLSGTIDCMNLTKSVASLEMALFAKIQEN